MKPAAVKQPPPTLFGVKARWSDRLRAWCWRLDPLTACAYQTPTGQWWISGAINSFHVASRPHAELKRAISEIELHMISLNQRLSKLIAKASRG